MKKIEHEMRKKRKVKKKEKKKEEGLDAQENLLRSGGKERDDDLQTA